MKMSFFWNSARN